MEPNFFPAFLFLTVSNGLSPTVSWIQLGCKRCVIMKILIKYMKQWWYWNSVQNWYCSLEVMNYPSSWYAFNLLIFNSVGWMKQLCILVKASRRLSTRNLVMACKFHFVSLCLDSKCYRITIKFLTYWFLMNFAELVVAKTVVKFVYDMF